MRNTPGILELRKVCQPADLDVCLYRRKAVRRISIYFTRFFIRFSISADTISAVKGVIACSGSLLFYPGKPVPALAGALLLQLSFILDACDGEVARYTGSCGTGRGEFIDKLGDTASRGIFYGAWGFAVFAQNGGIYPIVAGAFIAGTWLVVRFCAVETVLESFSNHPESSPGEEEMAAVSRLFVKNAGSGRAEYLLSLLFHPWINLASAAAVATIYPPAFRIMFWGYAVLWLLNTVRKIRQGLDICSFRRPKQ